MTPFYADPWLTVYAGDCREVLRTLPDESVHCVVTSPPYFGLRDYGTAAWTGGEDGHAHIGTVPRTMPPGSAKQASNFGANAVMSGDCACGATRQDNQLGLEPTPEQYVENMVAVFREVRRVLRNDGTLWLNLGDSYAAGPDRAIGRLDQGRDIPRYGSTGGGAGGKTERSSRRVDMGGLKPKDLVGIPWRVAFALQADGWYLRSDIIWSKPNPMPESVTDRPTKSHEYLFLLAKSPRYFFDADAVREPSTVPADQFVPAKGQNHNDALVTFRHDGDRHGGGQLGSPGARNIRSVWTIPTAPYPGAHFAVFPPKLVEPCVKAGTSERGVCPECGAPWRRVVERVAPGLTGGAYSPPGQTPHGNARYGREQDPRQTSGTSNRTINGVVPSYPPPFATTTGWEPTCACLTGRLPVPAVILDPFAGSGTVGVVAQRLSRRAILIDLNPSYIEQQLRRNRDVPLGLVI